MRALWKSILLSLCVTCVLALGIPSASANQCAMAAIHAAKSAGGNQRALGKIYDQYFGEALARQPVAKDWKNMSTQQRKNQIDYARRFVVSLAGDLAKYANASFKWSNNTARVTLNGKTTTLRVTMSGGCTFSNICVGGNCLASLIGDVRKHKQASR